ncbi:MAG: site-2 protease family protein [Nitrososphaerota archaeon]|nr:site-2 protease family protein [Nitrososphaerota archaeon]
MTISGPEAGGQEGVQRIIDAVHQRFSVKEEYLREEGVEFFLEEGQRETKRNFVSLTDELRKTGDGALLRNTDHGLLLVVFKKPVRKPQRLKMPLILLAATIITIAADGFLRASSYADPLTPRLGLSEEIFVAAVYTIALIGIIGIHELGHKIASWHHKMDSSWPFFIPGIPGVWPTMGAVISASDPPTNRDALFDLGLSGPIAGLIVTVIVSIVAAATAQVIPASSYPSGTQFGSADYFTSFLTGLFKPTATNGVLVGPLFYLLYFAYSIGFLITFINLLPAWQLDGGHITNSAVSPRVHQILTYVSVLVMILIGFYLMAFLVLIMAGRTPSLRPLDDVSPLSNKRKVFFVLTWVLSASIFFFAIYNNAFFGAVSLIH